MRLPLPGRGYQASPKCARSMFEELPFASPVSTSSRSRPHGSGKQQALSAMTPVTHSFSHRESQLRIEMPIAIVKIFRPQKAKRCRLQ